MPTAAETMVRAQEMLGQIDREAGGTLQVTQFTDPNDLKYAYWRKPDGWLTFHQTGANALDLPMRGWVLLYQYGGYPPPQHAGADGPIGDPYFRLLQAGGAKEFPPDQLLQLGWHLPPGPTAKRSHRWVWERVSTLVQAGLSEREAIGAVLPALAGLSWEVLDCPLCPGRRFTGQTREAAEQLRHKHELIVHQEDARTRELRDSITQALGGSGGGGQQSQVLEALVAVLSDHGEAIKELLKAVSEGKKAETKAK